MKKILTVSLVAMMAVSTARADIASTAYVQGAVSAEAALRAEAVEGINEELAKMATSSTVAGIQNTLSTLQTTVTNNKETTDQTQADLDIAEGKITTLEGTVAGHTEDISEINTALTGKQATIGDLATIRTGAAEGATAVQLSEVTTGSANGTISVQNTDVAVKGLGSAAYTASTDYATAAQGVLATNAVPQSLVKSDFATASSADKDSATAIPTTGFAQDMIDATFGDTSSQLNTLNSKFNSLQSSKQDATTAVTHTASTAVGTTAKPVYIASSGAATVVSSIDSSLLPTASSTTAGLAKWGQIPSGSAESTTYATIWVE